MLVPLCFEPRQPTPTSLWLEFSGLQRHLQQCFILVFTSLIALQTVVQYPPNQKRGGKEHNTRLPFHFLFYYFPCSAQHKLDWRGLLILILHVI